MVVPLAVLVAAVQVSVPTFEPETIGPEETLEVDPSQVAAFVAGGLLVFAISSIANQLAAAASFRIVSATYLGEELGWRRHRVRQLSPASRCGARGGRIWRDLGARRPRGRPGTSPPSADYPVAAWPG